MTMAQKLPPPPARRPAAPPAEAPPPVRTGPDVPWEEAVALCRRFHGWGEYRALAPPPAHPGAAVASA